MIRKDKKSNEEQLNLRMTREEKAEAAEIAAYYGMNVTEAMRYIIKRALAEINTPIDERSGRLLQTPEELERDGDATSPELVKVVRQAIRDELQHKVIAPAPVSEPVIADKQKPRRVG